MKEVKVSEVVFSETNLGIIAGPCVIENREHSLKMALEIKKYLNLLKYQLYLKVLLIKPIGLQLNLFEVQGLKKG